MNQEEWDALESYMTERVEVDAPGEVVGPPPDETTIQQAKEVAPAKAIQSPTLIKAASVPYEPPRWLIAPYFQRGKGTLIQADNGTGKTALACAIAAHVSTGSPLLGIPIETPGNVMLLSVEDDLPILRGRIEASGGDLDKCFFMSNAAGLTFNSPEVEVAVKETDARLIIFDPFQCFLGAGVDMHRSNETRPQLAKLFEMADRNDCAVAIIAHMGKADREGAAVNRSLGSVDIPAAMRSILHVARNPEDENEVIAVHVKCSNAPKGRSLSYSIGDRGGVSWNKFSNMTVEDLRAVLKREEKGVAYEREPLVQVFNQMLIDKPGGGYWPYAGIKEIGMKLLGFPPFSTPSDLRKKLNTGFARELMERDGIMVVSGVSQNGTRGIRVERYVVPTSYQTKVDEGE